MRFDGHTHFVTVGQAIGTPASRSRPWPRLDPDGAAGRARALAGRGRGRRRRFTTIGNWRGYGSVEHGRRPLRSEGALDARVHGLPRRTDARFRLALAIHPGETPDLEALGRERLAAGRPGRGRGHAATLSGVHPRLVRRARHREERLRPVALRLVQRSKRLLPRLGTAGAGAGDRLQPRSCPTGEGLLSFSDLDERRRRRSRRSRARLRAARPARARSSRRSTSTRTGCSAVCSSACRRGQVTPSSAASWSGSSASVSASRARSPALSTAAVRVPDEPRAQELDLRLDGRRREHRLMLKSLGQERAVRRSARRQACVPLRPAA